MERLGERIKEKRVSLGLQVKDLSAQINVTPSLISQIERAKAFPSIITLKKIADALSTTVGELIGENDFLTQHPVLTKEERRFAKQNAKGTKLYLLSHHDPLKQIEPYLIEFKKKSDSTGIMTSNYPGQEFCFVLKGSFKVVIEDKEYIINEGDGFYFNSKNSHLFTNISKDVAKLIWIITPVNFKN